MFNFGNKFQKTLAFPRRTAQHGTVTLCLVRNRTAFCDLYNPSRCRRGSYALAFRRPAN